MDSSSATCMFSDHGSLKLPRYLAAFLRTSDQLEFNATVDDPAKELRVLRGGSQRPREILRVSIGCATRPIRDKRGEYYVRVEVVEPVLGIKQIHLRSEAVRDYFYFWNRGASDRKENTLYELLRVGHAASPAELRLAFKVRALELNSASAGQEEHRAIERAFNVLTHPELRACYDQLLFNPDTPALFPYGGFGSIIAAGELSANRDTFFASRILLFLPGYRTRHFRAPLRKVDFLDRSAVYRDSRRKVEVFLDEVLVPLSWDPTWNHWKNLVGTKFGIEATFVKCGKYRLRHGEWTLSVWETALPSRIKVTLPADVPATLATARATYRRFGQYFDAMHAVRERINREPLEWSDVERLCGQSGIPPGFDIAQIAWRPDYDPLYYNQLRKRSRKLFLYRGEFIFELERTIVVEIPEQGHATYVFSCPDDLERWVHDYSG
ncbi:MAG: hypothetical protein LC130_23725, partial [Bryobacterales bacterium]|nr:hypothetical protein [Bryobacterales bacterium]